MKKHIFLFIAIILVAFVLSSCVSGKLYNDLKKQKELLDKDFSKLKDDRHNMEIRNLELVEQLERLQKDSKNISSDKAELEEMIAKKEELFDKLNQTYEQLVNNKDKIASQHIADTQKLLLKLQASEEEIKQREKKLSEAEAALQLKEDNLQKLNSELESARKSIESREEKISDLEKMINKQDSITNEIKIKMSQALLGFKDKGITVEIKNGNVYVSLEEQLLFKTGSAIVDAKGVEALTLLSKVLAENTDLNVLIEGHTDNVPFKGTGTIKDNWDLSVLRSTAVVRILMQNKNINLQKLTTAGRSEYMPIAKGNTPEDRKKNRRIEIILTPDLNELYQMIGTN